RNKQVYLTVEKLNWIQAFSQNFANRGGVLRCIACYVSSAPTKSCGILVGLGGLEPPTSPLSGVRSNHLSYRPRTVQVFHSSDHLLKYDISSNLLWVLNRHRTDVRLRR